MLEQYADPITTNDDIKNRLNDFHHIHGRCFHLHDHVLRVKIIINIKNHHTPAPFPQQRVQQDSFQSHSEKALVGRLN